MDEITYLGVISDTHLTELTSAVGLAEQLMAGPFKNVEAILHAGDMIIPDFESCFNGIPFYAVQGNMDNSRAGLPLKRIIDFSDFRIGLIHGWGPPSAVARNVLAEFHDDNVDLLIFGHSHSPFHAVIGQVILFNPGSAVDHRGNAECCSVGLIEIGQKLSVRHVPFTGLL